MSQMRPDRRPCKAALLALLAALPLLVPPVSGGLAAQRTIQPAYAAASSWASRQAAAREVMAAHVADAGLPGATVAVVVDGELVWTEGFGFADLENRLAARADTRFRIASISKALTAAGVGLLVQEGRLDLDAPIQRYVPGFPRKPEGAITTRLAAGHLAGIRHYRGQEFASAVHYPSVTASLEIFRDDPLEHAPGSAYLYSTYGWTLVSAAVEGASGEAFVPFMRRRVLEPLGLAETVVEYVDSIIPGRARFYQRDDNGRIVNAPFVDNSNKWAGGGYLSTARDMARYGASYMAGTILDPATVELLWTPQTETSTGEPTGYGIGWRSSLEDGRRTVSHTGGAMGGSTVLLLLPDDGVSVSILTNLQGAGHVATARRIAHIFAQGREDPPGAPTP